ncbi:hypothetical protein [Streptomyces justiciae]|uniref:Gram-positive cocci surface proteins LPxTG domain-containing protein n=1 Tax=Streptomyces justiciae TaxID=2780140 RepID=A0ABU3M4X8_9ACTN|nr:hypothetical protein [Streptomyces justiciae]MDT7846004.1 hypothetical protein [Streptomyces justiciae]
MRKALTVSAIAVAASMALAVPATAFAADTGPTPSPTSSTAPDDPAPAPQASLSLSKDNGAPGAKVDVVIEPGDLEGAAHVTSDAFGGRVNLTEQADGSWKGTATVKGIERSYYGVTGYVGSTEVDTVKFTVTENNNKPKPSPVVGKSVILLGKSSGRAGDKVAVTLDAPSIGPHNKLDVRSAAFGGRVHLTQGKDGKWHGTATVAKVRNGSYDVTSPIARTVHFKVIGSGSKPHGHGSVQPLAPGDHKTPKGSVDTGMAPAAASATTSHAGAAGLLLGTGVLGAASLAGAFGLRRRKNND